MSREISDDLPEMEMDLRFILGRTFYWWPLMVVGLGLGFLLALWYLKNVPPQYSTEATLLMKEKNESTPGESPENSFALETMVGSELSNNIRNELNILQSRLLMESVVERLNLEVAYFEPFGWAEKELYLKSPVVLSSAKWRAGIRNQSLTLEILDQNRFRIKEAGQQAVYQFGVPFVFFLDTFTVDRNLPFFESGGIIRLEIKTSEFRAANMSARLEAKFNHRKSSVVTLKYRDSSPEKAVVVMNTLLEVYDDYTRQEKTRNYREALDLINRRIAIMTAELASVEAAQASFLKQNEVPTEAEAGVSILMAEMREYEQIIQEQRARLDLLRSIEQTILEDTTDFQLIQANIILEDIGKGLGEQIAEYNRMVLERKRMLNTASRANPVLEKMNRDLLEFRKNILRGIQGWEANIGSVIRNNESALGDLKDKVQTIPMLEKNLINIKRRQKVKEEIYLFLLRRKEAIALKSRVVPINAILIDQADSGKTELHSPVPNRVYATCMLIGFNIPFTLVFLAYYLDNRIRSEGEVLNNTKIPFAGSVPPIPTKDKLVVSAQDRSLASEMFRRIRDNLSFLTGRSDFSTLMVTSLLGGEGKSLISVNLGMALAIAGKKTVIIGADLRKPRLRRYLEAESDHGESGLSTYLSDDLTSDAVLYSSSRHPNLFYIPSGPLVGSPSELFSSGKMVGLLRKLKEQFDVVILDTPPVSLVSDTRILTVQLEIDATLFAIRCAKTPKGVIRFLNQEFASGGIKNPAIVLNDFAPEARKPFEGYRYGYGYGAYASRKSFSRWKFLPN